MASVTRGQAVQIAVALGYGQAESWDNDRMAEKLAKVAAQEGITDNDLDDEELNTVLAYLVEQVAAGEDIEIVDDAEEEEEPEAEESADEAEEVEDDAADDQATPEEEEEEVSDEPETPAKPAKPTKKKTAAKKPKKKAAPAAKAPPKPKGAPGVRAGVKSRSYFCGVAIAKAGLEKGITEAAAKKVDDAYAKLTNRSNEKETLFAFRNAYHAIEGYLAAQVAE